MKKIFCIISIALVFIISLFFLDPQTKYLENGLQAILSEDYATAEIWLNKLRKKTLNFPFALYEGYFLLAQGEYKNSATKMDQALMELDTKTSSRFFGEIFLSQAIVCFFESNFDHFNILVQRALEHDKQHPLLPFFITLCHYQEGNFAEAALGLEQFSFADIEESSHFWLSAILNKSFTSHWQELHRGFALCECNSLHESRQILEKELFQFPNDSLEYSMSNFFLGYTFLKEGSSLPLLQKGALLKMAILTMGSVPSHHIARIPEKDRVAFALKKELSSLFPDILTSLELKEALFWGIPLLDKWGKHVLISELTTNLSKDFMHFLEKDPPLLYAFCQELRGTFAENSFPECLLKEIFSCFSQNIKENSASDIMALWDITEVLSSNPTLFIPYINYLISGEIYRTILADDTLLTKTQTILSLFQKIQSESKTVHDFSKKLFSYAKLLWLKEGEEQKGTKLMEMALELAASDERGIVLQDIEAFFTELYIMAEKANTVRRLALLHDAFSTFSISQKNQVSPSKIANHLADGYYLLSANQFTAAQIHAEWVLKLDPENQEALRLHGLACFHQGNYHKAIDSLERLCFQDTIVCKALMVSEMFAINHARDGLAQIQVNQ